MSGVPLVQAPRGPTARGELSPIQTLYSLSSPKTQGRIRLFGIPCDRLAVKPRLQPIAGREQFSYALYSVAKPLSLAAIAPAVVSLDHVRGCFLRCPGNRGYGAGSSYESADRLRYSLFAATRP